MGWGLQGRAFFGWCPCLASIFHENYNAFMTLQTFRQLLAARPFKPFRIIMSSGESYEIRHPEMAWLTRTDLLVGIDVADGVPAEFRICSLLHTTAVEHLEPASS